MGLRTSESASSGPGPVRPPCGRGWGSSRDAAPPCVRLCPRTRTAAARSPRRSCRCRAPRARGGARRILRSRTGALRCARWRRCEHGGPVVQGRNRGSRVGLVLASQQFSRRRRGGAMGARSSPLSSFCPGYSQTSRRPYTAPAAPNDFGRPVASPYQYPSSPSASPSRTEIRAGAARIVEWIPGRTGATRAQLRRWNRAGRRDLRPGRRG